jgi:hypothetical protein
MSVNKINKTREKRRGPIPLSDPRTHCVSVRLNDEELFQLDNNRGKMARGEYLRCAALDKLQPIFPEINKEAWAELSKAANNLNQISKRLNGQGLSIPENGLAIIQNELAVFRSKLIGAKI